MLEKSYGSDVVILRVIAEHTYNTRPSQQKIQYTHVSNLNVDCNMRVPHCLVAASFTVASCPQLVAAPKVLFLSHCI